MCLYKPNGPKCWYMFRLLSRTQRRSWIFCLIERLTTQSVLLRRTYYNFLAHTIFLTKLSPTLQEVQLKSLLLLQKQFKGRDISFSNIVKMPGIMVTIWEYLGGRKVFFFFLRWIYTAVSWLLLQYLLQ